MFCVRIISLKEIRNPKLKDLQSFFPDLKIIPAIDAKDLNVSKCKRRHMFPKFNNQSYLTPGEFACARSHAKVLKDFIVNSEHRYCIILEDDVLLKSTPSILYDYCNRFNFSSANDNTILHLGGMEGMKFEYYFKIRAAFTRAPLKLLETKVLYRACAYLVTKTSAAKHYQFLNNVHANIADNWFDLQRNFNVEIISSLHFAHPRDLKNSSLEGERNGK